MINYNESERKTDHINTTQIDPRLDMGWHILKKPEKGLSMMMLICIKQHSTNTWCSMYEKVKEHWG